VRASLSHSVIFAKAATTCAATYAVAILALLSLGPIVLAEGGGRKLVLGSVYRVVRDLIEVKQEGGDLAVIKVDSATKYIDSTTRMVAKLKDLAVGDQIVIKVIVKAGVETAEEVKFVSALRRQEIVSPQSNPWD